MRLRMEFRTLPVTLGTFALELLVLAVINDNFHNEKVNSFCDQLNGKVRWRFRCVDYLGQNSYPYSGLALVLSF